MKDLNSLFSGAGVLASTSDAVKITMENGLATIKSVNTHTGKKSGKLGLRMIFSDNANPTDETQGHEEYISISEGARFIRVYKKLAYIAKHSSNEAAKKLFGALPNPLSYIQEPVADENGVALTNEDGSPKMAPITFNTNEELATIRDNHGDDVTFIWADDDNNGRVAVRFNQPEAYINQLKTVFEAFIGEVFYLETTKASNGFQQLKSITKPKL